MVITADHESPDYWCHSAIRGGFQTDGLVGPWRAGTDPGGQPACSAFNVGVTLTFYDPDNTGGASNECSALQGTLSWKITWFTSSG